MVAVRVGLCVSGCASHDTKAGTPRDQPRGQATPPWISGVQRRQVGPHCRREPKTALPYAKPPRPSHRQSENGRELRSTASARSKSPVRRYRAGGTSAAPWTSLWVSTSLIHRGCRLTLPTKRQRQGAADATWIGHRNVNVSAISAPGRAPRWDLITWSWILCAVLLCRSRTQRHCRVPVRFRGIWTASSDMSHVGEVTASPRPWPSEVT